jgi:hypothetical protein
MQKKTCYLNKQKKKKKKKGKNLREGLSSLE